MDWMRENVTYEKDDFERTTVILSSVSPIARCFYWKFDLRIV